MRTYNSLAILSTLGGLLSACSNEEPNVPQSDSVATGEIATTPEPAIDCDGVNKSNDRFSVLGIDTGIPITQADDILKCTFGEINNGRIPGTVDEPSQEISFYSRNGIVWGIDRRISYSNSNAILATTSRAQIDDKYGPLFPAEIVRLDNEAWSTNDGLGGRGAFRFGNKPGEQSGYLYSNCKFMIDGRKSFITVNPDEHLETSVQENGAEEFAYCGKVALVVRDDNADGTAGFIQILVIDYPTLGMLYSQDRARADAAEAARLQTQRDRALENERNNDALDY